MTDTEAPTKETFLASLAAIDNGAPEPAEVAETPSKPDETPAAKTEPVAAVKTDPKAGAEAPSSEAVKADPASAAKPDEKPKSKWAQNEERKAKSWEQINAEKQALQAEREAIARAKAEIEAARKVPADQPYRDEHGLSAADYRAVEKQLREKGDAANADAAAQLADNIARKEQQVKQQQAQQELAAKWKANFSALQEKHADLKDPNSELYKETAGFIREYPQFATEADGIKYAVQAAQLRLASKDIENTKADNAKLKAQYEQLQKKLQIGGGAPTSPAPESKSFEAMNSKERAKYLMEKAASEDRERGFADS